MITNRKFDEMAGNNEESEPLMKPEMMKRLEKEGRKIRSKQNVERILKEYFGIEVGDTIITYGKNFPKDSEERFFRGKRVRVFELSRLCYNGFNVDMNINGKDDDGESYSGGLKEGIFWFFVECNYDVLKRGK